MQPSSPTRFRSLARATLGLSAMFLAMSNASADQATVRWAHERCEYVLIERADGHGLIMQFSAERLKPDDVIEAEFQFSVNSGKVFTNIATQETGMLRGYKFGLTRAQAVKFLQSNCKKQAPQE